MRHGFRVARKHADKLRRIATLLGFVVPIICVALGIVFADGPMNMLVGFLAAVTCQIGIAAERWLFFAEAKHAVMLYYGEQAV